MSKIQTRRTDLSRKIRSMLSERLVRIYQEEEAFCYILPAEVEYDPTNPEWKALEKYRVSEAKYLVKRKRQRILEKDNGFH